MSPSNNGNHASREALTQKVNGQTSNFFTKTSKMLFSVKRGNRNTKLLASYTMKTNVKPLKNQTHSYHRRTTMNSKVYGVVLMLENASYKSHRRLNRRHVRRTNPHLHWFLITKHLTFQLIHFNVLTYAQVYCQWVSRTRTSTRKHEDNPSVIIGFDSRSR